MDRVNNVMENNEISGRRGEISDSYMAAISKALLVRCSMWRAGNADSREYSFLVRAKNDDRTSGCGGAN
jgi:hypothetical protein